MVARRGTRLALLAALAPAGCFDLSRIQVAAGDGSVSSVSDKCGPEQIEVHGKCVPEPPSCLKQTTGKPLRDALARSCGPDHNESCCQYDLVDTDDDNNPRTLQRSYDETGVPLQDNTPVIGWQAAGKAVAKVSPFYLDRFEVTVGRFKALYNQYDSWLSSSPLPGENAGAHAHSSVGGWRAVWKRDMRLYAVNRPQLDTYLNYPERCDPSIGQWLQAADSENDNRPMSCINWYEAYLFCIFDGGRLPTEAEWNYAAAGGAEQRAFPWKAASPAEYKQWANVAAPNGEFRLLPVGSFPRGVGKYGQHDLAGNVLEWVHDRCRTCDSYETNGLNDPIEMFDKDMLPLPNPVARGGSYRFPWASARTAYRETGRNSAELGRFHDTGWRCARNAP